MLPSRLRDRQQSSARSHWYSLRYSLFKAWSFGDAFSTRSR
jgi:hypothetical protein